MFSKKMNVINMINAHDDGSLLKAHAPKNGYPLLDTYIFTYKYICVVFSVCAVIGLFQGMKNIGCTHVTVGSYFYIS